MKLKGKGSVTMLSSESEVLKDIDTIVSAQNFRFQTNLLFIILSQAHIYMPGTKCISQNVQHHGGHVCNPNP